VPFPCFLKPSFGWRAGNCRPIHLPSISPPCGCHPLGFAFPPLGPIKVRGPLLLVSTGVIAARVLLHRQIPRRSHPIKSFSIFYLILFRMSLMSVLHLVVVLVIG
jgi:hypothetical protein